MALAVKSAFSLPPNESIFSMNSPSRIHPSYAEQNIVRTGIKIICNICLQFLYLILESFSSYGFPLMVPNSVKIQISPCMTFWSYSFVRTAFWTSQGRFFCHGCNVNESKIHMHAGGTTHGMTKGHSPWQRDTHRDKRTVPATTPLRLPLRSLATIHLF